MDFPSTINEIGDGAFANCSSLGEVNIPNRDVKIYDNAFYGCKDIDINKIDCIIVPAVPKRIFVVFNKDGVRREAESTAIWMLFKTKEEAEKCYIGEYEYGKRDETFIKRDKLIYW